MAIVHVDGIPIAYTDTGAPPARPDAPTIVFGHGLLFGGWMFGAQIAALRGDFRCVTIDWRGQGATAPTAGGYDMDTLTADAVGVIRELGLAPVHWVGLSMGGFVGQRLAARHPHLLRTLTLLDTSADAEEPDRIGEYKRLAHAWRFVGGRPILPRVAPHLFGPRFRADPANAGVLADWGARLRALDRRAVRDTVLGVADRAPVDQEITAITVPTLVAVGADDVATPPMRAERIAHRIPAARLHTIPDSGHSSTLEQPAAVTALLRDFLGATRIPIQP